ncbi:PAS domain S-box protein [Candidatus Peregrinibacteria bacterium]|nr:PAS domain S-box protein [Candidatus Peregrinibacteria bacterium]
MHPEISPLERTLVEHMNEAVWMVDEKGNTAYVNPAFCRMMEYTPEEIVGKSSYDCVDAQSRERVRQVDTNERTHGISSTYETTLVTKSGKRIHVLISGTPLTGGGSMGIMTDLTFQKKQESIYTRLVEHMNEAVWIIDAEHRAAYVNPKFCELVEYSFEELQGLDSYFLFDDESRERVRKIDRTQRKQGISSSYEAVLVTKSGRRVPVLMSGTPLPEGCSMGICLDLTQLRKKEEQERILTGAIQYAHDAILTVDGEGRIMSWNRGSKITFGYKRDEMLGQPLARIFAEDDVADILSGREVRDNFELRARHRNGEPIIVSATLTPIFSDGATTPVSWLLILHNITMQTTFEEELAQKYQKLRDAYNQFGIIRRQMDYVFDLIELCAQQEHLQPVGDFIVNAVLMLTRVDACLLRVYRPGNDTLEAISSFGLGEDWRGKKIIRYAESLTRKAHELGRPLKIVDIAKVTTYHSRHLAKKSNLRSLMVIPLLLRGELLGSLSLYVTPEKKLEIFDNHFIEKYASVISIVLAEHVRHGRKKEEVAARVVEKTVRKKAVAAVQNA